MRPQVLIPPEAPPLPQVLASAAALLYTTLCKDQLQVQFFPTCTNMWMRNSRLFVPGVIIDDHSCTFMFRGKSSRSLIQRTSGIHSLNQSSNLHVPKYLTDWGQFSIGYRTLTHDKILLTQGEVTGFFYTNKLASHSLPQQLELARVIMLSVEYRSYDNKRSYTGGRL